MIKMESKIYVRALKEVFDEEYKKAVAECNNEKEPGFSKKFTERMNKLIKQQKRPYFYLINTAWKKAACIVTALIVFTASMLSVKAVRDAISNVVIYFFPEYNVITTKDNNISSRPETIEVKYTVSNIPEGYILAESAETTASFDKMYINEDKYILFSQYVFDRYTDAYDNEQSQYKEEKAENGQTYLYVETSGNITYIWDNGIYIFKISSNLPKEEVLELCKATKSE